MIAVVFDPPLERSHFKMVLPKVQAMFPDWTWCGNTGTPTVRERRDILTGALHNQHMMEIGVLLYDKQYEGESDCLMYSSGWNQKDAETYERLGKKVETIDGWSLMVHKPLDTDDVFSSLSESKFKRIVKESIDEFEWTKDLGNYDINGWYVTKPARRWKSPRLHGNLYRITLEENNKVEVVTWPISFFLGDYQNLPEEKLFNAVMNDYLDLAKHEMKHALNKITAAEKSGWSLDDIRDGHQGPYYWDAQDVVEYLEEGYFIKLS